MQLRTAPVFVFGMAFALSVAGCDCGASPGPGAGGDAGRRVDGAMPPGDAGDAARGATDGAIDDGAVVVDDAGTPDGGMRLRCAVPPSANPFENPALELHWRAAGTPFPNYEQAVVSPVVIDFLPEPTGDAVPEIVFITYRIFDRGGVLRVIAGRPPYATLMTLAGDGSGPATTMSMATPSLRFDSHPAAADLDGDGHPEIVATLQGGGAVAFRSDGSELWRTTFPATELDPNGAVAIADMDHDGLPEVVMGRVVMDGQTGAVRWTGTGGRGLNNQGPLSCIADVDGAGSMELIAGSTVYTSTGSIVWRAAPGTGDGFCAVADLVNPAGESARDGVVEVVRVADGKLYLHDGATGAVRWMHPLPACMGQAGNGGAPTVADFDGDGLPEVGVAGAFCYTVFDPGCDVMPTPATCHSRGVLWQVATEDDSSNVTSSTVFDFNGDGRAEVVYNDEQYFFVFEGGTGTTLFHDANPSRTRSEQPVVADVDADGNAEIVFTANMEAGFAGDSIPAAERIPGLEIWSSADDSWVGARPIWNQHTYHIDNVDEHGGIPRNEAPSWTTHDTYRLNVADVDALLAPNLRGRATTFDTSRCGEGILRICAEVSNAGDVMVGPGLRVAFYDGDPSAGGTLIASTTTTRSLAPGGVGEVVCADWTTFPTSGTGRAVFAVVDADGAARECVEDDNTVNLGFPSCVLVE